LAVYDIPATELIEAVAADLKKQVKQPEWADFVKSGRHCERAPHRRDWFYVRMASVLYRVYREGHLGTNRLRTYYGGRRNRGVKPHHFYRASGKVIRVCLQELEKLGFVKKEKGGRSISGKGESYLNAKAKEIGKELAERLMREKEEAERIAKEAAQKKEVKKEEAVGKEEKPVEGKEKRGEAAVEKGEVKKEKPKEKQGEKK